MSRFFQRFVFVFSVAIFATLGLGFVLGEFGLIGVHAGGEQDGAYRQMRVYAEVLSRIQSDYVTEPNMNDVTTGALQGLLESLDADSSYLAPAEYKIYKEHSTTDVAQVGIVVSKRFGYAIVVSVLPGSQADKEHLSDGDIIESIGSRSTRAMPLAVVRMMLEGKPGSTVTLSIVRPRKAEPDKLTLTRTVEAPLPLIEQQYDGGAVLYLKPGALTASSVDGIEAKIKAAGKGCKILLDLRDSAGNDPEQGLRLAADPAKFLTDVPLAVVVNRGTYGAAELTAAAIEGLKRGDVVGEQTFGEASVQQTFELPDGAAVLMTVAKYEGPDGKKIEDVAVTPNVLVGQTIEEEEEGVPPAKGDEPLEKALQLLKAKNG